MWTYCWPCWGNAGWPTDAENSPSLIDYSRHQSFANGVGVKTLDHPIRLAHSHLAAVAEGFSSWRMCPLRWYSGCWRKDGAILNSLGFREIEFSSVDCCSGSESAKWQKYYAINACYMWMPMPNLTILCSYTIDNYINRNKLMFVCSVCIEVDTTCPFV